MDMLDMLLMSLTMGLLSTQMLLLLTRLLLLFLLMLVKKKKDPLTTLHYYKQDRLSIQRIQTEDFVTISIYSLFIMK